MCGGTTKRGPAAPPVTGLSPRVRGNLSAKWARRSHHRSIPACAGEPGEADAGVSQFAVYPRVCGGTATGFPGHPPNRGLSPRVRGNQRLDNWLKIVYRSIPACAGEPVKKTEKLRVPWVYPRVCGGTRRWGKSPASFFGLSPRVRGNPAHSASQRPQCRSIPACAGEPSVAAKLNKLFGVYPRVCGGTIARACAILASRGLSPRVRGNRGGAVGLVMGQGLSPRVRGNRPTSATVPARTRSIPACAGEPRWSARMDRLRWVYPRVCGGTSACPPVSQRQCGLSPRVRGNRHRVRRHGHSGWSIPACAGEPCCQAKAW